MTWAAVIRSPGQDVTRVILADTWAEAEALARAALEAAQDSDAWAETVEAEAAQARADCPMCGFNFSLEARA